MLLIYTPEFTERVKYTFALFFNQLIKTPYLITSSHVEFQQYNGPKFSYAPKNKFGDTLYFKSADLLFEDNVHDIELHFVKSEFGNRKLIGLFETKEGALPFDIIASAFFLVSRYEEYIIGKHDHLGRFKDEYSAASHGGFLDEPMVNYYALSLINILQEQFPALQFEQPKFTVLNTVDVDMAWKYKHKGILRNLSGLIRDVVNGNFNLLRERTSVLFLNQHDPFQSFDYIIGETQKHKIPVCFFWLLGKYSDFDKNINRNNNAFRSLIKHIHKSAECGIHFSFRGHKVNKSFEEEHQCLTEILNNSITKSRFHFLKFDISKSFYKLIQLGIKEDYSMGYSAHSGFRASIANPFYWFDLNLNQQTDLLIHPLIFMDATIRYHKNMSDEATIKHLNSLLGKAHEVGGQFVALWHNDIFEDKVNDWKMIFEWFNQKAASLRDA